MPILTTPPKYVNCGSLGSAYRILQDNETIKYSVVPSKNA